VIGSASVELEVKHGASRTRILFSGDVGPRGDSYLRERPDAPEADVVVMECTTGARPVDAPVADVPTELREIVADCRARDRTAVLPTFSLGRAQVIVHHLARLSREGAMGEMPVYLDSPMAIRAGALAMFLQAHLLQVRGAAQDHRQQFSGRLRAPDAAVEPKPREHAQAAAVVDVRMGADHGVERAEVDGRRLGAAALLLVRALEQPEVDEDARTVGLQERAASRDLPGGPEERQRWGSRHAEPISPSGRRPCATRRRTPGRWSR